jgi:hypothetical protein
VPITRLLVLLLALAGAAQASTTIDAHVIRNQAGSGSCLVSSGFPLPPGLVTEAMVTAGTIKVTVAGSEVAANVTGLRGRHHDGTLRSVLIQFTRSMAQNDVVAAQVIVDGGVRANEDPAYVRPTLTMVTNNNAILPTSPTYLTSTLVTFQHLLATGGGSATEEKLYTDLADNRFTALMGGVDGPSAYEEVRALLNLWVRTGETKYYNEAVRLSYAEWLVYNTPTAGATCPQNAIINPDGRTNGANGSCGLPNEQNFSHVFGYASMYLLTGYRDFWSIVAHMNQWEQVSVTSQVVASNLSNGVLKSNDSQRTHYAFRYGALIPSLMIDATVPVSGSYGGGRAYNWPNQLSWTLETLIAYAWDLKWLPFNGGAGTVPVKGTTISQGGVSATLLAVYRDDRNSRESPLYNGRVAAGAAMPTSGWVQVNAITGGSFAAGALTGISASATGAEETDYRQGATGTYSYGNRSELPNFQTSFITNWLIDYYLYVQRDSRIPALVQKNVDVVLANTRALVPGDYFYQRGAAPWNYPTHVYPYQQEIPVTSSTTNNAWTLPMHARSLAFLAKTVGGSYGGTTYADWYTLSINPGNVHPSDLGWSYKIFGETFGFDQEAPWMMAQTSLVDYGPETMRTPTAWAAIPGDVPDLARTGAPPVDSESPVLTITSPASSPHAANGVFLTVSGTASDDTGVEAVTWACPACTPASGTAQGGTTWSFTVSLGSGANTITVTATDAALNTDQGSVEATYTPSGRQVLRIGGPIRIDGKGLVIQ